MSDNCRRLVLHRIGVRLELFADCGGEIIQISILPTFCCYRLFAMGIRRALRLVIEGLLVVIGLEENLSGRGSRSLVLQELF